MSKMLGSFGRRDVDPKLNKPTVYKPAPVKLAQSPVVARIRKTQFGSTLSQPTGINVKQVASNGAKLLASAPKLQIHKI